MRFQLKASWWSVSSMVLGLSSAYAAQPIALQHANFPAIQQQFHLVTPTQQLSGSSVAGDSLRLIRQHEDSRHITHFRLQQQYAGFDVFGGYAIVHGAQGESNLLHASKQSTLTGLVYNGLDAELGAPPAHFEKEAQSALNAFIAAYQGNDLSEKKVTPMIYMDAKHQAHWAYKVSVLVRYQDKIPAKPTAIVDAVTFKPFVEWNEIKTALSAVRGQGFGGNSKTKEYAYDGVTYPYLELTRNNASETCYLNNKGVNVVDMKHEYSSSGTPMKFSCPDSPSSLASGVYWTGYDGDGYDRENGAYSPTNDALYFGYVINHLYKDWYNENALSNDDGTAMKLVMRVHYGDRYENAFWDGMQMTFGDGEDVFYPLVSLGVGAHEISHGFTEQHSDLLYFGQSGGMNESFSDMAAQAAEYYSNKKNSWMIGAEIMKESSGYTALRFMDKPSRDGVSIDTADEYYEGLGVHYSSGVFNRLFYLMAKQSGWNTRKAFNVMVKANMDYWTPYTTFEEASCGVLRATDDLGYSLASVKTALDKVKINYEAC